MSAEFNFTDNQWYNFICGFHAGMKLKDMTLPPFESNIVLEPIPVGGSRQIGLGVPFLKYEEGNNTGQIPVYTHDVDIGYSGFSVNIKWDSSRLRFDGVTAGDFGTIGDESSEADIRYSYSSGEFKARSLLPREEEFDEPVILFYIDVTIIGTVTRSTPIGIFFDNSSPTNLNSTTMLRWVDVGYNDWYTFFITPISNRSGAIVSDLDDIWQPLGDESIIAAPGSPSGVYVGIAYTEPGDIGVLPITSCSNVKDNFPYNTVHCIIVVEDKIDKFNYIRVVGVEGFSVEVESKTLASGYVQLDITATRSVSEMDAVTFCYIQYSIDTNVGEYTILVSNSSSELGNGEETKEVVHSPGAIYYLANVDRGMPSSVLSQIGGDEERGGGGSAVYGTGMVFSGAPQIVWLHVDSGAKYPIYLGAGWNKVSFYIPTLQAYEVWIEAPIIIEAEGYLLIPAGFEWNIATSPKAPEKLGNRKMIDRFKLLDLYAIEIETIPNPPNLDNIGDEVEFEDFEDIEIQIKPVPPDLDNLIEDWGIGDFEEIDIEMKPVPPNLDNLIEDWGIGDFEEIDIEEPVVPPDLDNLIEELSIEDTSSNEVEYKGKNEDPDTTEGASFSDIYDIEIGG